MALALVQSTGNEQGTTGVNTMTVTFSAAAAGNLLVAAVCVTNSATANLASLTTPAGYSRVVGADHSGAASPAVAIYWKQAAGGETSVNIVSTQSVGVSSIVSCEFMEFSGYTSWNVDVSNTNDSAGSVTTLQTGASGTLATATEVVVGAVAAQSTIASESWNLSFNSVSHTTSVLAAAYLLTSATTSLNPAASWTTSRTAVGGIVAFKGPVTVAQTFTGKQNVGGPVNKTFTGKQNVGGRVARTFTGKQNVDGPLPAGWSVKTQVAWTTDPLTRPAEIDWTTLTEGIRSLTIKRGTRILSTGLETGTATVVLDNSTNRDLDPNYTGSAYFPNVIPRRRIRFVLCDASGNTLKVLHTGFIEKYGLGWSLDTAQVTIPTQDLFGLIAGATLPSSVLDVVTRGQDPSAPVTTPTAYWPMHETVFTGTADDVIGTLDGTYVGPVTSGSQLTRFDPRPSPQFAKPGTVNGDQIDCTAMVVTGLSLPDSFSFSCWFKWNVGGYDNVNPAVLILQAGSPPSTDPAYPTPSPNQILMYLSQDAISGRHHINIRVQNGTSIAIVKVPIGVLLLDGDPHHLAFSVLGASKEIRTWCDGFGGTVATDTGIGGTVALSTLNVSSIITSLNTLGVGWGIDWNNVSGTVADSAIVGETAYWASHVLTDPEVDFIVDAGNNAWDGDTTDERADRLFDLIGVDPGDRNFAVGTQTCGPTILGNQNALAYFKKIVATEQGAGFVDGDGRATLTARPTSPPIVQTFSDDPVGDSGAAAEPIRPENDWSRIVNTVTVGRENGADQTIQDTTSAGTFGPLSGSVGGKIDTLHQTADDARATGQFVVDGHKNPTSYIPDVKVSSVEGTVALSTLTDVEVADLVAVIGRPPSPLNEPIVVHAQVEHVQYDFPNPTEMTTTYSPGDGVQIIELHISDGGDVDPIPSDISDGGSTDPIPTDISDGMAA